MTDDRICPWYVDAGAGWCQAKKAIGRVSLYCPDRMDDGCRRRYTRLQNSKVEMV